MDTEEASYIIGIFDIDQRLHLQSQFQLQQLKEQLQNLSIMVSTEHQVKDYRDGCVPKESDIFIAVMGVTGAGKSTFISKCTTREVKIGHELQACTQDVTVYHCSCFKGVNVFLIDTPGFDDTHRSDKEVLKEIACWLGASYRDQVKLHGIIYLHRITDPRMQGSARKNLLMFKKLCGPAALKHVILATTMWERLTDEDMGLKREQELIETEDFWGWMKKQGSQVIRHQNTWESAMDVLGKFVKPQKRPIPLQIQTEIVDGNRTLDETSAGQELQHALSEEREKFKRELEELQAEMKEALTMRDEVAQDMIRESREELNQKLLELERDRADLKVSLETMYSKKLERLEQEIQQQQRTNESFRGMFESMKLGQERSAVTHGLHHEKIREQEQNHKTMLKQQQSKSKAQIDPLKAYSKGLTKMALYDFTGNQPDQISFKRGNFIMHYPEVNTYWWIGQVDQSFGFFPSYCVEENMICKKALSSHDAKDHNELTVKEGDLVTDIRVNQLAWWFGRTEQQPEGALIPKKCFLHPRDPETDSSESGSSDDSEWDTSSDEDSSSESEEWLPLFDHLRRV